MILFSLKNGDRILLDPHNQNKEQYEALYTRARREVSKFSAMSITASGKELQAMKDTFVGVPMPATITSSTEFIWLGEIVQTLVANIMNSAYNGDSSIIIHPEDINDYRDSHS